MGFNLMCEWGRCRAMWELVDDFYIHLNEHIASDISSVSVEDGGTYICRWCECDFSTANRHDLIRHLYFHGFHTKVKWLGYLEHRQSNAGPCHSQQNRNIIPKLPDEFKCCWENCCMVADIPDKFYEHVGDHVVTAEPEMLPCGKMGLKCHWEGCKYQYVTNKGPVGRLKLKSHVGTHTQERRYACARCGKMYVNKTKLIDHFARQIDVEDRNFKCPCCSGTFASKRILKDHMRVHVNRYRCEICSTTWPSQSALKHHITYKHSLKRPYACEFCEYRSKKPHDMKKHMDLMHKRDPAYPCQVAGCDYEVRPLRNLHDHYRAKHGNIATATKRLPKRSKRIADERNEVAGCQSNYRQLIKECSVMLVRLDSAAFPNQQKLLAPQIRQESPIEAQPRGETLEEVQQRIGPAE